MSKTKYRFKTLKEVEKQYGFNWRKLTGFNQKGFMDYLLGESIEDKLGEPIMTKNSNLNLINTSKKD